MPRIALGRAAPGSRSRSPGTRRGARSRSAGRRARPRSTVDLAGAGRVDRGPAARRRDGARASTRRRRAEVEVTLRPSSGGARCAAPSRSTADLGVGAGGRPLRDAPAEATAVAEALDLGFLPALAPGLVRTAGGTARRWTSARQGPLARMSPRGHAARRGGRLAIAELGEWTDVALDARVTDDVVELARLDVRRGPGKLSASGALRGLVRRAGPRSPRRSRRARSRVTRAGMELATFDVAADATGTCTARELALEVNVPHGVVRLPKKTPRTLQPLERAEGHRGRAPARDAEAGARRAGRGRRGGRHRTGEAMAATGSRSTRTSSFPGTCS